MDKPRIRPAIAADVPAIAKIVDHAYRHYIARMGKPPGPMLEDYAARVSGGAVWVLEEGAVIAAIIVLLPGVNHLLLDNIAVSPNHQGLDSSSGNRRQKEFNNFRAKVRRQGDRRSVEWLCRRDGRRLRACWPACDGCQGSGESSRWRAGRRAVCERTGRAGRPEPLLG